MSQAFAQNVARESMAFQKLADVIQIELERAAFDRHAAGPHFVERAQHPAVAAQRLVGEADDQPVWLTRSASGANLPGDCRSRRDAG